MFALYHKVLILTRCKGAKILNATDTPKPKEPDSKREGNSGGDKEGKEKELEAVSNPLVSTFTINVASKDSSPEPLVPLPAKNEALTRLLEGIGKGNIELGKLPAFGDKSLASLTGDYKALGSTTRYTEPSNMKEDEWSRVLANTRALHGYWYDFSTRTAIKKARKTG
jgi:hypothetical protein